MIIAEPVLQDKKAAPLDSQQPKKNLMDTYAAEMRIRNYSKRTIKTYSTMLRAFANYIRPVRPRDATAEMIRRYLFVLVVNIRNHHLFSLGCPVNQAIVSVLGPGTSPILDPQVRVG